MNKILQLDLGSHTILAPYMQVYEDNETVYISVWNVTGGWKIY